MNAKDKEQAIKRYEERLSVFGKSVKTMGWRDERQQELRFEILAQIGDLDSKKILDVGCGFGDYYSYLLKNNLIVNYTGYDLSLKITEIAKNEHQGANFAVKDILIDRVNEKFDYVFSSGIFNHKISNNMKFAREMIRRMFEICNLGIAFNMMTDIVDYKEEYLFYYSPEKIFNFAKTLSRYVILRHDYPLYEFTIYIYKKGV